MARGDIFLDTAVVSFFRDTHVFDPEFKTYDLYEIVRTNGQRQVDDKIVFTEFVE
jgi:hypothetical protein